MFGVYDDIRGWYDDLSKNNQLLLWQLFSSYLNNNEINLCMSEVRKGKHDLFEIHYNYGFLDKYQIYFQQVIRKINDMGDENESYN
ncbi:MAG: hypothetical protein PF518_15370 [Spirochaetaceae bacterium]|jgi:hypothetical protein|nr:hypothetical protein [Spirochaetaceae bacterium]